ncbi:unnamed protein product [Penicillium nalgiovense]|uniref:Uncharacterized protein n=3 Tax=Penicillium TaxID=5073 RepID=A0A9W4IEZ3_9EURO|nr:unnamed protein product [Penicillium salamii]CAG7953129.1 unnamed protein product [Penicillium nalgiovense]CRL27086.1 unnamed protein product [Penicillium camemberti]CAG7937543.1 unnamed protein product [Penicillium salamii]CAG7949201.1 unnamed protein product [Penicillium salamii]
MRIGYTKVPDMTVQDKERAVSYDKPFYLPSITPPMQCRFALCINENKYPLLGSVTLLQLLLTKPLRLRGNYLPRNTRLATFMIDMKSQIKTARIVVYHELIIVIPSGSSFASLPNYLVHVALVTKQTATNPPSVAPSVQAITRIIQCMLTPRSV